MFRNINKFNLVKWYKMLTGNSILHVNQGEGKVYDKNKIKGYYNDLTEKVLKEEKLNVLEIPKVKVESGDEIIFPIAVFQYGLGAYDLFLINEKNLYLEKFKLCADWALISQKENGAWENFFFIYPESPFSAMAQGEGASLLIRAFIEFEEIKYLDAAKKAIDFMLLPIEEGGTTLYKDSGIYFQEFTHKPTVLNGWIFAFFGLYDYVKLTKDEKIKKILDKSLISIESHLSDFDNGYWSLYNVDGTIITSPFYHNLHIAQLNVLYKLFNSELCKEYMEKWSNYQNNLVNRKRAFIVKVYQKLTEK